MDVLSLFATLSMDASEYYKTLTNAEKAGYKFGESIGTTINKSVKGLAAPITSVGKIPEIMNKVGTAVSSAGQTMSSVGSKIENFITKPALAAGTAMAGIAVAKGWSRMTQIDEAKAKLRGLGHEADSVQNIMDSALKSVKGTAFGMDEAATTAASAVAAGIKEGEDLTKYLTTVGDAASIAGVSMGDMGAIFNKVTTAGKAQNDVLGQLADKGIPIYQWLAEETGHAADEIFDMARKGEIDLATFRAAVENHVGGAAKELGNATLTGAIANVWASVSRIGANFLGAADDANSFAGQLLPLIIKLQDGLGKVEDKAKEWGKTFGELFTTFIGWVETGEADTSKLGDTASTIWGKVEPILNKIREIIEFINGLSPELKAGLAGLAVSIGPLLKYGGQIVKIVGLLISNGPLLVAGIATLIGTLAYLTATGQDTTGVFQFILDGINQLGEKIPEIASKILEALPDIMDAFTQIAADAIPVGTEIIEKLVQGITEALPTITEKAGEFLSTVGQSLIDNLPTLISSLYTLFSSLMESVGALLPELVPLGVELILTIVEGIADNADKMADGAISIIIGLTEGIINALPILIEKAPEIVYKLITAIIENAPRLAEAALTCIQMLGDALIANFPIITEAMTGLGEIFLKVKEFFTPVLEAADAFIEYMKTAWTTFAAIIKNWIENHKREIHAFVETVKLIVTTWINTLKAVVKTFVDFAKVLIQNFFNTVKGIFRAGTDFLKGNWKEGLETLKNTLNTNITNILDAFTRLKDRISEWARGLKDNFLSWGRDMIQNLIDGIRDKIGAVGDAIGSVADKIREYIHFSEPDVGPLSDFNTYAPDMMKTFARGLADATPTVTTQLAKSLDKMKAQMKDVIPEQKQSVGVETSATAGIAYTDSKRDIGNIYINVYGTEGQDVTELADIVGDRLMHELNMRQAVMA